tara:strand:+ start:354 stop:1280 length:927 start_codon:yes stop_codon:yes gene_type:complete
MSKKTTNVTAVGILILITAFGYSWITTIANRTEYIASDDGEQTTRERMSGMDDAAGMGMMDYQDGLYTSTISYEIPYGYVEPMEVTLQLEDNIVTDVSASFVVVNPVSENYQQLFLGYVSKEVVGKQVDDVALSRMAGASLTNRAFDAALSEIKAEATGMPMMRGDDVVPMQNPGMSGEDNTQAIAFELPSTPSVETSEFVVNAVTKEVQLDTIVYKVDHSYTVNSVLTEPMWTTIIVRDGIVQDTEVEFNSPNQVSMMHQQIFVDQYRDEIVGQPIDTASVSRISYASLTTEAFNDALKAIRDKQQA